MGDWIVHARVAVPTRGDPPVVLVHGLGVSGRYLLPTAELLVQRFPVYVPDLPGYGRSAKPARALGVAELADALAAWMETFDLARAPLVGNSLGCQVLIELALRHPERAGGLVLVGPTVDGYARSAVRQVGRLALASVREPPSLLPIIVSDYLRAGPRRVAQTGLYAIAHDYEARLAEIAVPALVVRGGLDPLVSQAWAEHVARLLPHGRLVVMPGSAHAVNFAAPAALAAEIERFVAESWD